MLNVCFVCWLMDMFVVSTWLQHKVLASDNTHGVYFPVLEGILNCFILPFSILVLSIISFGLLFLLKAMFGCSWNNSHRFMLVCRMFQSLRTTALKFGKNWLYLNINGKRFWSCYSKYFYCSKSSLTSLFTANITTYT